MLERVVDEIGEEFTPNKVISVRIALIVTTCARVLIMYLSRYICCTKTPKMQRYTGTYKQHICYNWWAHEEWKPTPDGFWHAQTGTDKCVDAQGTRTFAILMRGSFQ